MIKTVSLLLCGSAAAAAEHLADAHAPPWRPAGRKSISWSSSWPNGARFLAQRYRLSHTAWRRIRGGMQGSMIAYGVWSALYLLTSFLTVFQLLP